jgi:hypothetical protein
MGSSQRRFSWLLFSDLKMGAEEWQAPAGATFMAGFWRDLESLHAEAGPFDALFFAGDFVHMGRVQEYETCSRFLDELFFRLHRLGSSPVMFCVPGNHDLVRSDDTAALSKFSREAWERPYGGERERALRQAFGHYAAWAKKWPTPNANWGQMPGDFSADFEKEGVRIGIIGLNTSVNQGSDGAPE